MFISDSSKPKNLEIPFQNYTMIYVLPLRHVVQSSKLLCFSVRNFATLTLFLQQDLLAHYYMFFMAQKQVEVIYLKNILMYLYI